MSLQSWVFSRIAKLGKPLSRKVLIEPGLRIPMRDGVTTLATRYAPPAGDGLPVVLIRTPYGQPSEKPYAEIFAARGYQVIVHSCRGRFGSEGEWLPFQTDRKDGLDTIEWIREQPWYGGKIGMYGPSYLGFVQWAVAGERPEGLVALALQVTASNPRRMVYPGGAFSLRTMLAWTYLVGKQGDGVSDIRIGLGRAFALRRGYRKLPLRDGDREILGHHFPFYQGLVGAEDPQAELWSRMDCSRNVPSVTAATHTLTGWYDIFLLGALDDYRALRKAGKGPELVIGPWGHSSLGSLGPTLRESVRHFDNHLRDQGAAEKRLPVRIYVMGADEWLAITEWPPPTTATLLYLQPVRGLDANEPHEDSPPDRYRYNPADPTPDVGGTSDPKPGSKNNRSREKRPDVVTYTTQPLQQDLEVVGSAVVKLWFRSSLEFTDVFCRLCDVRPNGKSTNVCDGITRLTPEDTQRSPDDTHPVTVELWPTAHRFKAGHRIRLQVSSGAHPRFARNSGTGEPLGTAKELLPAEQEIYLGRIHPSVLILPVHHRSSRGQDASGNRP